MSKKYFDQFKQICQEHKIDPDKLFQFGKGTHGPTKNGLYQVCANCKQRKDSQLYVVQYCCDINLFIAWNLKEGKKGTSVFSVDASKLAPGKEPISKIIKNAEYKGRGIRTITYFRPEYIAKFLQTYVLRV